MKFNEAMDALIQGKKVTREQWEKDVYFCVEDGLVNSYRPILEPFNYFENIMITENWLIEDEQGEFRFCDIIPYLLKGLKVKMNDWKDSFIYYDKQDKSLVLSTMRPYAYRPDFSSFIADDWIVIEDEVKKL